MNKTIFFAILLGYFAVGCSSVKPTVNEQNKGGETVTLKFVQINDVYEIAPLSGGEYGGLARVAHIRDSIKEKFPNTYMFLAGDFLNPSLIGTLKVDGERVNGKQMVEVLNAMEIDLVTFGNHEFDLDEDDLQKRLNESTFEWTSANVRQVSEGGNKFFKSKQNNTTVPATDYSIFKANNAAGNSLKFGVFGVTLPSNPKDYVFYGDIYNEAERAYNLALQESDFVVGLTHVAIDEDIEIAKRVGSVPLIMGGHEHFNMLEKVGNTIISKADANAKSLYVHTFTYNLKNKYLQLDSELVMVTDKIASSPKVKAVVDKWTEIVDEKLKEVVENPEEVIYTATIPLDGTDTPSRSKQTNLGELIARSMAYSYNNEVAGALVNGGSIRIDDKLEGDITSIDIFRVLPFGGSVLKVALKGKLLKEILDYGELQSGEGAYLQRYNFSRNNKGAWQIGDGIETIVDSKTYTVAFSDFLLKGLDIPFLTPENKDIVKIYYPKDSETPADIRKAIIYYLKSQKN
ncbi:bifunctional metallophosphatase/5'-nucleotidase [Aequorivita flava]|uniref:Bifunctional metallophosphatase/5'-nucleotidase n=1 Tax=Aequorivita flava TaxID=3114371 RepID=A0AB35YW32_9FLAO